MKRRDWIFASAALAASPLLRAQAPRVKRVGIAAPATAAVAPHYRAAFKERLRQLGWTEGRDIEFSQAFANNDPARYEPAVSELLAQRPDILFVPWGPLALVAKKLAKDTPIVFAIASTPEQSGLVASLARPGGHVTGVATREREFPGKRIELLREIIPGIQRLALLANADYPGAYKLYSQIYGAAAQKAGLQLLVVSARSAEEFGPAIEQAKREGAQAIVGIADVPHYTHRRQLYEHLSRAHLPSMHPLEEYVESGGLVSYGIDMLDEFRRAAVYVDKILRGAKPADLPVEEPNTYVLAINLNAARALGIKIPQPVLIRATRVIE
jgi:putative ABC transport system substrate-binding protein